MEYLAFLAVAAIVILLVFLYGIMENKKSEAWFRKKRIALFGKASEKTYATNRLKTLVQVVEYAQNMYKNNHSDDMYIVDQITWNDLDMDDIFQNMDYTVSSAGENALYKWLRIPEFQEDTLKKREKHIQFFQNHEKERLDYQFFMSKIGFFRKYTIFNYLDFLDVVSEKSAVKDVLFDVSIVATMLAGIFFKTFFIYISIVLMVYQGYDYFMQKKKVEPYFSSLSYLVKIINTINPVLNMSDVFKNEFANEVEAVRRYKKDFASFVRGASLALEIKPETGAGDLVQLFIQYLYMIFHFDLIKFYSMLHTVNEKKDDMIQCMLLLGEIEACISVAYFRERIKEYTTPVFVTEKKYDAKALYHPLISNPVKNDICPDKCILLTGSNASGKSTFLKTVSINALMAQTIHTVCAQRFCTSFFQIYSSMALRDNLAEGESYFIVEIKSMKRIFDAVEQSAYPILCTIDEVLRGTNTAERIGASTELLKSLSQKNDLCFAATHDLELTTLLSGFYENYHFEESVKEKEILFSYQLKDGPARGRNAIKLLETYGFDQDIIEKANKLAGEYA